MPHDPASPASPSTGSAAPGPSMTAPSAPTPARGTRRRFLRQIALGSAGLAATPFVDRGWVEGRLAGATVPGVGGTTVPRVRGEPFWEAVKARFPIRQGLVPLNAANLCPASLDVIQAVEAAGRDVDGDVSFQNRAKYDGIREEVREGIAEYLGVSTDEIALVRNTSEGNNTIVGGLSLGAGDEVVVFDQNHPTNNVAWDARAARAGFSVRRVQVPGNPSSENELLDVFVRAFGSRTRAVSFSDVSNVTGVRLPVAAICAAARERGIHAHVDGAQSFGAEVLDLRALGCDSYATSGHKWFMGPKETGVLYVRGARIPEIWPLAVGVGWGSGAETTARGARKFETLGQRNDAAFAGLAAALALHLEVGPPRVEARVRELAGLVKEGLAGLGATLTTPLDPGLSGGVVVVAFEGVPGRSIHERLYEEYDIAGAPTGGLRFCPHVYNTRADVERAIEAVARVVRG